MPKNHLVTEVLYKLNENQLALGAAIEELSKWIEQRGSVETAENVRAALFRIHYPGISFTQCFGVTEPSDALDFRTELR